MKTFLAILLLSLLTGCAAGQECGPEYLKPPQGKVCFNKDCFSVELAVTPQQLAQGLMYRKCLPYNKGMFFLFGQEDKYGFWMKNTLIPLDIIWINKDGSIVFIKKNAQPCKEDLCPSISPRGKAMYVLELNAGVCDDIRLKIGDRVTLMLGREEKNGKNE